MDSLTSALKDAHATLANSGEFRILGENASLWRPLVGRGFHVWELKPRLARNGKARRNWRLGARLSAAAPGVYSQWASDLDATPPGIRKAGFREVLEVLRGPVKGGYPPSVATDAHLGFSVMAYRSAEVLFGRCEGQGRILVRLVGTCSRAHQGRKKEDIAQPAKVEYCPCCARPAHVALPSCYAAGEYSGHKARGVQLRKDHSP